MPEYLKGGVGYLTRVKLGESNAVKKFVKSGKGAIKRKILPKQTLKARECDHKKAQIPNELEELFPKHALPIGINRTNPRETN